MISPTELEQHFVEADGFPRPQWEEIAARIHRLDEDDQAAAWETAVKTWLTKLAVAISDDAAVLVDDRILLLASCDEDRGADLFAYCAKTRAQIERLLRGLPGSGEEMVLIVIVLGDAEQFYDYINYFHGEDGEYGGAAGMFITSGYPHVVVGPGALWVRHATIAHELTHNYLYRQALPLWLEEGLAQMIEEISVGAPLFLLDHEIRDRHRAFWSERGLDDFWSGTAFGMPGDVQQLAYELALILLRAIASRHRKRVGAFVGAATWEDAGDAAATEVLGEGLAAIASDFLGPGSWAPGHRE